MATELNVDLPPRYTYAKDSPPEENLEKLAEYILQLHSALEEMFRRVFLRSAGSVDDGTEDNIATIDGDEALQDSGVEISTDGTMAGDADTSVPTEAAVVTYVAAQIAAGGYLPLGGGTMTGDIDMDQNEIKQLVIENRGSDPASPVVGEIWYRSS